MIPKIIHYCWFGGNPLPEDAKKCIESWKKFLPDYEIKEWNESNFDVNIIPYTREAYRLKKYAFVSDYARFWVLYQFGGIYFDTDVEVIRPLDDIVARGGFMGCETDPKSGPTSYKTEANPGLGLGVAPGLGLIRKIMDYYEQAQFEFHPDIKTQETVVAITTRILREHGLKDVKGIQEVEGVWIYPSEYFCPINITTMRLHITSNTRTIHHYAGTWIDNKRSIKTKLKNLLPESLLIYLSYLKAKFIRR
ncbi:MAG: glycosyltransferase [Prevotella sp.]|nr:glycosyltransferase [Prevotella sp.]